MNDKPRHHVNESYMGSDIGKKSYDGSGSFDISQVPAMPSSATPPAPKPADPAPSPAAAPDPKPKG